MEKFTSQQDALRTALTQVLGESPKKGQLVITAEQRTKVGELMMSWLKEERWSIRPGTRAASNPLNYIVGKQPTCLIEAWVTPRPTAPNIVVGGTPPEMSKFELIKQAHAAGFLTKEQAHEQFMALLNK
jgi:hypothetical protein